MPKQKKLNRKPARSERRSLAAVPAHMQGTAKLLRRRSVEIMTGLPTSSLYELVAKGVFPAPISITENRVAWIAGEVDQWIQSRIAASRGEPAEAA